MASSHKTLMTVLFMFLFLLQQHNYSASARKLGWHAPPAVILKSSSMSMSSKPPTTKQSLPIHRYKKIEDAFRPTSPGHSPGVGHGNPPAP
ncbi:hypothetical protein BVC80_1833g18 [Macleaya cordata]|uniref:Uncharacterized protein n=1 Tax=Macleaya cordata TaxID=56857 RepID=A0A200R6M9_MACCD|nr:hypothetical protein BVC80_1833g18 [Macleaya cordata]